MLPRVQRMRSGVDFQHTIRRGSKGAQPTLVTHLLAPADSTGTDGLTSVGFVVSKAVGSAVERNRVKRRLRHLMRDRLDQVPAGARVVVRALPAAQGVDSRTLGVHLDAALTRSLLR